MAQLLFSDFNWLSVFILVLTTVVYLIWLRCNRSGEPPGPTPFPIIGNYLSIDPERLHIALKKWQNQYGDIYTAYLGSRKVVVVCGFEKIRDILTKTQDAFLDRTKGHPIPLTSKGIVMSNGGRWRETRRFTLITMKDMGLGQRSLERKVVEEADALCAVLNEHPTKVLNMQHILADSVANVICSVLFGQRFEYDDPEFDDVIRVIKFFFEVGVNRQPEFYFPWLLSIPVPNAFNPGRKAQAALSELDVFIMKQVEKHLKDFDAENPRDLVDLYLQVVEGKSEFNKDIFDESHFREIIRDLFLGGTNTTATALLWIILHLSLDQGAQQLCRKEILEALGDDGIPNMTHRSQMPFVEATIAETFRVAGSPFNLLRTASQDYKFHDYVIKKGTDVMMVFHSVHNDPQQWPEPERFRPERWLDNQGKFVKHENLVPFSLGRRNCPGESIARTEIFIFMTMLLQRFSFKIPDGHPRTNSEGRFGFLRTPEPFEVEITSI